MTNAEIIATIRAEIERQQKENINYDENGGFASYCDFSAWSALDSILTFVSCLEESEKPIIPITVTVLDNDLNPVEITADEKPMNQEGLKEEIDRLWESFVDEMEGPHNLFDIYARLAHHFAQWGAEHFKK